MVMASGAFWGLQWERHGTEKGGEFDLEREREGKREKGGEREREREA